MKTTVKLTLSPLPNYRVFGRIAPMAVFNVPQNRWRKTARELLKTQGADQLTAEWPDGRTELLFAKQNH